jgi:hypothetical protein
LEVDCVVCGVGTDEAFWGAGSWLPGFAIVAITVDFGVGVEGLAGGIGLPVTPALCAPPVASLRVAEAVWVELLLVATGKNDEMAGNFG